MLVTLEWFAISKFHLHNFVCIGLKEPIYRVQKCGVLVENFMLGGAKHFDRWFDRYESFLCCKKSTATQKLCHFVVPIGPDKCS